MQNILKKLHAVMCEIDYIQKDKTNEHSNYNYASEYAIKTKLHEQFVTHGILFQLEVTGLTQVGALTSANFAYTFFDIESGESLRGVFAGQGADSEDKGIWKAITGAIKYILTSTFLIPAGNDPEEEAAMPPAEKPVIAPAIIPENGEQPRTVQEKIHQATWMKNGTSVAAPSAVTLGERVCSDCGKQMKQRKGPKGMFWGCTGYPACHKTERM